MIGHLLEALIEPFLIDFAKGSGDFRKYEIAIRFNNGDRIEGSFRDQAKVREFLQFAAMQ
ncbi:MAG: hypothetical protein KDE63_13050 [Novosphingobium sp.]|nr:hypothetical protein [Candidatus Competibacteraceae bacterium]MCB2052345.1 hypothetical protein [Novosphingobium sp.]